MTKSMTVVGVLLFLVGAGVFALFVLPQIGGRDPGAMPNGELAGGGLNVLAVTVASLGLAGGAALVGIGLGRWKRPVPSPHDGSPEV